MNDDAAAGSRTYHPGDWYGVLGPRVVVILPPEEKARVAGIWALADEGADLDEVLDALIAGGLRALSSFVLVSSGDDETRAVVRGPARASFVAGGERVELDGTAASTWVERTLRDVESMVVDVSEPTGGASHTIEHGLVRIARLVEGAEPGAAAPSTSTSGSSDADQGPTGRVVGSIGLAAVPPVAVPASALVAVGDADGDDLDDLDGLDDEVPAGSRADLADELDGDVEVEPEVEPEVALEPEVETQPDVASDDLDDDLADDASAVPSDDDVDPWLDPSAGERSFEDSFDTAEPTPLDHDDLDAGDEDPLDAGGLWSPTPVEPAQPLAYSSGAPAGADGLSLGELEDELDDDLPDDLDASDAADTDAADTDAADTDDAGDTGDVDDAADEPEAHDEPEPVRAPGAHAAPVDDQPTESFSPASDHDGATQLSPFDDDELELVRPGIPGQPPAPPVTARPVARLLLSTGETLDVDRAVVLGRAPMAPRHAQDGEQPLLVRVPSPHQEISSTHVEVRPGSGVDHGTAVVTDLGSTNGTIVVQPGLEPEELQPGVAVQLIPGAIIDLGDGVTIQVTRP